jgi:hypothetical protein
MPGVALYDSFGTVRSMALLSTPVPAGKMAGSITFSDGAEDRGVL